MRRIFDEYLSGDGAYRIANRLCSDGIPSYYGGEWTAKRVYAVLKNEKYTGNALLQKAYVTDHLTKKKVVNKGELPRYNALVERYDRVQEDLAEVNKTIEARNTKRLQLQSFIKMLKKQDGLLTEFDEELWYAVVDKLMVCSSTELTFIFKDGTELPWTVG